MKKLSSTISLFLFLLVSANFVFAETYKVTTSDGTEISMTIAPRAYSASGGKSEIRVPGTWTYTKGSISLSNGIIYPTFWSNYEKESSGTLNDNDLAQGAMMAIFYAVPSETCTDGAIITAIMEMGKATGMSNIGSEITMTPMSGFLCGAQITSFTTYTLTAVTTATAFISGSKTTTSTNLSSVDFTGSYKSEMSGPGTYPTMTLNQSGSTLTGTATHEKLKATISGTVSSGVAAIKVTTTGNTCTASGSGSGKIFFMTSKKISIDVKPDFTSTCGGGVLGTYVKQ